MLIVETAIFTRRIQALISDEQYRFLQLQLVAQPDVGKVIPQSGGLQNCDGPSVDKESVGVFGSSTIGPFPTIPF